MKKFLKRYEIVYGKWKRKGWMMLREENGHLWNKQETSTLQWPLSGHLKWRSDGHTSQFTFPSRIPQNVAICGCQTKAKKRTLADGRFVHCNDRLLSVDEILDTCRAIWEKEKFLGLKHYFFGFDWYNQLLLFLHWSINCIFVMKTHSNDAMLICIYLRRIQ